MNDFFSVIAARRRFAGFLCVLRRFNKTAFIFPAALLIFAVLGCRMFQTSPHKTDAQLAAELQKNREKFNRLIEMVKEDKKDIHVSYLETGKIEGMSRTRVEEYKKLLEELNLRGAYPEDRKNKTDPVTEIRFNSTNFVKRGEFDCKYIENKGFVWYETGKQPPKREVKNLDREYLKGEDVKAESRIDDNWSLYYFYETCYHD